MPYSQDETFDIPENFNPCGGRAAFANSGSDDVEDSESSEEDDEENVFMNSSAEKQVEVVDDFFQ